MKQLKATKHKEFPNTYIVEDFGKRFLVAHYLESDDEFRGEWTILEVVGDTDSDTEWVDTVFGKGYALMRISEIFGEKNKKTTKKC